MGKRRRKTKLARFFRRERRRRTISCEALAKMSGLSPVSIHKIESGERRDPRLSTVSRISSAMGLDRALVMSMGLDL
jgi:predicted transcriptional regulator